MKTYSAKPTDVTRAWYVIDANEAPLGRIATHVASLLMGKGKTQFTKHIDCGDFVIVTNAANLVVTGNRMHDKMYHHHSHYPGGLKSRNMSQQMEKDPTTIIMKAVRGMLPVNKLRDGRLARLKIYVDSEHKHEAQKPITISIKDVK